VGCGCRRALHLTPCFEARCRFSSHLVAVKAIELRLAKKKELERPTGGFSNNPVNVGSMPSKVAEGGSSWLNEERSSRLSTFGVATQRDY